MEQERTKTTGDGGLDDVDVAKKALAAIEEDETAEREPVSRPIGDINFSLTETDVRMIGDASVIAQVVQLLSYIRNAIRNNSNASVTLMFGRELANAEFNFDANGCQVPDLIPPETIIIN